MKPLHRVNRLKERLDALAHGDRTRPARIVVIGAGAGGVEVAFAAAAALDRSGRAREITMVDRGGRILNGYGEPFQRLAERALGSRDSASPARRRGHGGGCRSGRARGRGPAPQRPDRVAHGTRGGTAARALQACRPSRADFYGSRIRSGALPIRECSRSATAAPSRNFPRSRSSGVYAVREAPILWHNLLAAARDRAPDALSAAAVFPLHPRRGRRPGAAQLQGALQLEPVGLVAEGSDRPRVHAEVPTAGRCRRNSDGISRHPECSKGGMIPVHGPALHSG